MEHPDEHPRPRARRWLGTAAALIATGALVAGCGSSSSTSAPADEGGGASGDAYQIGAIVPSSGPFAEWGRGNTAVLKMLEKQVDDAGGVNGHPVKLTIYDDAADPAQSANLVRKLATSDSAIAIAGPLTSSSAEVAFPIANALKIVSVPQASSKPGVAAANRPWAFRNTIDESIMADATVPFFKQAYHVATAAIIYDSKDATAVASGTKIFPAALAKHGIKALNAKDPISFETGDVDVSAQVTKLKGLHPDGVVIAADYSQAITVLREMRKQHFTAPVIGTSQLISSAILRADPSVPIVAPATYYVGLDTPSAKKFTQDADAALKAAGYSNLEPTMYDANIYEIVQMFIQAIKEQGIEPKGDLPAAREKIRTYLASNTFQGLVGPISFAKTGDAVKTFYVVVGKDGKWAPQQTCVTGKPCTDS